MEKLAEDFYQSAPDTVIVISPHLQEKTDSFSIGHTPSFKVSFKDFGDLETKLEFKHNIGLAYKIKESLETKIPVILSHEENLDHGSAVPLYYLTKMYRNVSVIPISYSLSTRQVHFQFGQAIREIIDSTLERVAVVASGDLSHCLKEGAPAGYSPRGREFDKLVRKFLVEKDVSAMLNLDESLVKEAAECGFRSILILLGIFDKINYEVELLSYQSPFGVGHLVANLRIK